MNFVLMTCRPVREPELNYSTSGKVYCKMRVAVDGEYRGKDCPREEDHYFNVVAFGKLAQFCYNNLGKALPFGVVGKLEQSTYVDRTGVKRESVEIIAKQIEPFEWARKRQKLNKVDVSNDGDLLVPREITDSLFRSMTVTDVDEDIPDDLVGERLDD